MERTETQRRILEVGKKEFLEKGFKDASLNQIVAEAGSRRVHSTATTRIRPLCLKTLWARPQASCSPASRWHRMIILTSSRREKQKTAWSSPPNTCMSLSRSCTTFRRIQADPLPSGGNGLCRFIGGAGRAGGRSIRRILRPLRKTVCSPGA